MSGAIDSVQMPFGLRDGKLLHVSEVSNGLDCGCVCAGCKAQLVARKGKIKQHHFAHAANSDCSTGYETALHLAAKEIIDRRKEIVLPPVSVYRQVNLGYGKVDSYRDVPGRAYSPVAFRVAHERSYRIETVSLETRLGRIIPDVTAYIDTTPLIIEIKVTHGVDHTKLRQIKRLKISAVEIDLSDIPRDVNIPLLESLVIGPGDHKQWLYNRVARHKAIELQKDAYQARRQEKKLAEIVAKRQEDAAKLKATLHSQARTLPMIVDAKSNQFITAGCPKSLRLYRFFHTSFKACAIHAKDTETVLPSFASDAQELVMSGYPSHRHCEPCPYYIGHQDGLVSCGGMSDYAIAHLRASSWTNYNGDEIDIVSMSSNEIARTLRYLAKRGHTLANSAWVKAFTEELESRNQQGHLLDNVPMLQSA